MDNLYQLWENRSSSTQNFNETVQSTEERSWLTHIFIGTNLKTLQNELINVLQQNLGNLLMVLIIISKYVLSEMLRYFNQYGIHLSRTCMFHTTIIRRNLANLAVR